MGGELFDVSTHSRPKAAGWTFAAKTYNLTGFNTQPPEGGWDLNLTIWFGFKVSTHSRPKAAGFQTAAGLPLLVVSTHSRPKAAGGRQCHRNRQSAVSTHSRPKAAGHLPQACFLNFWVSTHSRPKAAGTADPPPAPEPDVSTHSRPKAAGIIRASQKDSVMFQHTAARRRLVSIPAAVDTACRFNTQPPEGGWGDDKRGWRIYLVSTHSRPKAAGRFY